LSSNCRQADTTQYADLKDADLRQANLRMLNTKDGPRFTVPKTAKSRTVRLTNGAVEALKRHSERQAQEMVRMDTFYRDHGLVFASEVGTPFNRHNVTQRSFRPLLHCAGLPEIHFHDLRHTCATLMLSQGVNPKIAPERLGHSTIAQTMDTYSHVLPDMQDQAAIALERALS